MDIQYQFMTDSAENHALYLTFRGDSTSQYSDMDEAHRSQTSYGITPKYGL